MPGNVVDCRTTSWPGAEMLPDEVGCRKDVHEVGSRDGLTGVGTQTNDGIGGGHRRAVQAAHREATGERRPEARIAEVVDRRRSGGQLPDAGRARVDADDGQARLVEGDRQRQADVAEADDDDGLVGGRPLVRGWAGPDGRGHGSHSSNGGRPPRSGGRRGRVAPALSVAHTAGMLQDVPKPARHRSPGIVVAWMPISRRSETIAHLLGYELVLVDRYGFRRPWIAPLAYLWSIARTIRVLVRHRPRAAVIVAPPFVAAWVTWPFLALLRAPFAVDIHSGALLDRRWRWSVGLLAVVARRSVGALVTLPSLEAPLTRLGVTSLVVPDPLPDLPPADVPFIRPPGAAADGRRHLRLGRGRAPAGTR